MSVLKGEGRVPILFGSTSVPAGSLTHSGYLARPDLSGEWPTVVLVPSRWGVSSSVKDVCRRLARQGLAVIAPDLYRGSGPRRAATEEEADAAFADIPFGRASADLGDFGSFISNPAGFWSNAENGYGLLGIGNGSAIAAASAGGDRSAALAVVYPVFRPIKEDDDRAGPEAGAAPPVADLIAGVALPVLGLSGRQDPRSPVDDVHALRAVAPHAEWVLYEVASHDYLDDSRDSWDSAAATDSIERITEFFVKHLPAGPG